MEKNLPSDDKPVEAHPPGRGPARFHTRTAETLLAPPGELPTTSRSPVPLGSATTPLLDMLLDLRHKLTSNLLAAEELHGGLIARPEPDVGELAVAGNTLRSVLRDCLGLASLGDAALRRVRDAVG